MISRTADQLKASLLLDEMAVVAVKTVVSKWVARTGIPVLFENLTLGLQAQLVEDQRAAIEAVFTHFWNADVGSFLAKAKPALTEVPDTLGFHPPGPADPYANKLYRAPPGNPIVAPKGYHAERVPSMGPDAFKLVPNDEGPRYA